MRLWNLWHIQPMIPLGDYETHKLVCNLKTHIHLKCNDGNPRVCSVLYLETLCDICKEELSRRSRVRICCDCIIMICEECCSLGLDVAHLPDSHSFMHLKSIKKHLKLDEPG